MPSGTYIEGIWEEDNCAVWNSWLHQYDQVLADLGKERLVNLDKWFTKELPSQILERNPPYIHHDELLGVTSWKMHRGVWREYNRKLVESNTPEKVEEISREAFAAIPDPRKPVALLATLSGVGPATASGVLAAYAPYYYPFFDEIVAALIPGLGPVAFTLPYYLKYASAIRERTARLNASCSSKAWTAHEVAQALWSLATSRVEAGTKVTDKPK
ncbi:MAG: hypothetical protein ABIQ44_04620 [Chloroflexia bacterium]